MDSLNMKRVISNFVPATVSRADSFDSMPFQQVKEVGLNVGTLPKGKREVVNFQVQ